MPVGTTATDIFGILPPATWPGSFCASLGKTRELVRTSENKWTLAVGSQGIITGTDLEEAMTELGGLTAAGWVGRGITDPEKYGLDTNNLSIAVELKSGEKRTVDFGLQLPRAANGVGGRNAGRRAMGLCLPAGDLPVRLELSLHNPDKRSVMRFDPSFWRKCRVTFRWCRITVWLAVLVLLYAGIWLNRIGLPDFLKTRLVSAAS